MADDGTLSIKMEVNTPRRVKYILEDFTKFSGHGCNVDKTVLMQVSRGENISEEILALDIDIKDRVAMQ